MAVQRLSKACGRILGIGALCTLSLTSSLALATPRDVAYKIFNRINGVPPSAAKLDELTALVTAGKAKEAALAAINAPEGQFYTTTLRNLVSRWTNRDISPRVPLNDYTATVLGMIRDDVPFNTVLSADILYTVNLPGVPAYSLANNNHYAFADTQGANLQAVLTKAVQSEMPGALPAAAIAGVMSTRGFGDAFYRAGTNRRAVAFTLQTFLCKELEALHDNTRADTRVRRDVTRAPGGDSAMYRNRCSGCHAGMDAFGGAFAFHDFDETANTMIYTAGTVREKFNRNQTEFPDGYVTTDDSWFNNWVAGPNAAIAWAGAASGNGAKALGAALANSGGFNTCMASRAVEAMCLRAPVEAKDKAAVATIAASFKDGGYLMKDAFAAAAAYCAE